MSTTILITGVNRGIGAGLIKAYISQPNHTVIAAVRDPSHKTTIALSSLPAASNSKLLVVAYDASREGSASSAVADLQARGVSHLDIVIANAGIAKWWGPVLEAPRSEMLSHFTVNTLGALELYQATRPLLAKGKTEGIDGLPKFAYISTTLGSIGATEDYPFPAVAYGTSKAAMNYVVKRAHLDNKDVDTLRSIQGKTLLRRTCVGLELANHRRLQVCAD